MSNDNNMGTKPPTLSGQQQQVPSFVYGLAFLISTILSSGVAAYLAVQGSVDKYIEARREIQILEINKRSEEDAESDLELRSLHSELSGLRNKLNVPTPTKKGVTLRPTPTPNSQGTVIAQLRATIAAGKKP